MSDITAQCIFCDDIRQEVGGKLSYMGVYTDKLSLPSLPFILPVFSIFVKIIIPLDKTDFDGVLVVDMIGQEQRLEIKPSEVILEPPPDNATSIRVNAQIQSVGFKIAEIGAIKVYMQRNGEMVLLDRLDVVVAPPG